MTFNSACISFPFDLHNVSSVPNHKSTVCITCQNISIINIKLIFYNLVHGGSAYSDIYQSDSKNAMVIIEDNGPKIRTLTVPITKLKQLVNAVE
ncbi:hypothetical protein CTM97_06135 [Photobacterium phosphoreum]|uniref:Uncharacterized protein n=1 Tax=Photobacterium phosphoreum TaxID=659 RepID=A0A2T3JTL1_PHOPO|nr:hypothetical protein CTM96_07140 [Photobacterium phosphoreum]PSU43210.1 hypothetical protein CTM97_06135 [Photobacterium phosphoreum]PSU52525.1 hypothetical protein C9J18_08200 [Photobacterium phosphoreum]